MTRPEPLPAAPARTERPRVLFAATSLEAGSGGIQRVARLMGRVLLEDFADRATVSLLSLHDEAPAADVGAPVRCAGGSRLRMAWHALRTSGTHLITDTCNLGRLRRLPGLNRPHLAALHGIEIWEGASPAWVSSAKAATVQMFNSDYTRRRAERAHGRFGRAEVCWLATEAERPPPPRPRPSASAEVLVVGRMVADRDKGHRDLIAAWPSVVDAVPGATLRVVGRGPGQAALEALAAQSGAGQSIVFEGFATEERLDELYARATAFAMPSRGEGFGIVYIEAMRHGLPVVASVHDAAPEIVLDGGTGFTVDLDAPGQLADRVIRLLREPGLADRFGAAARCRWAEHFRFSCFRKRFGDILGRFLR
ncbi:glycosyltransferase family 4 protein [Gemmata sp. JC717]|uniref:glycosyltransferase family 4 protein n=1 Tax=Gemmata algarum TaxID=2975278 RepID=UPI0021BAF46B|nr:glycosyltransferase family 4 protein [Gemmata algarum]MDY3551862.1 glycosyltransferase family 4 protein [Gemmata algarum]